MATIQQRTGYLFEQSVTELQTAGCALLPMDYVDLHRGAARAVDPEGSQPSQFSVQPVPCGRALLQVPTIRAAHWWETCGSEWYGYDDTMSSLALAYVSHHSRDKDRLTKMYDKSRADRALMGFRLWLGVSCTTTDLRAALERLDAAIDAAFPETGDHLGAAVGSSACIWGDTVARLCGAYHDLDPHAAAFRLSVVDAYSMLVNAPSPFGSAKPERDTAFQRYAAFRQLVDRLKKERKCSVSA